MIKITSNKHLNKIAKGALAMVLAGSFTFTASQAFADGTTNQTDSVPTVNLQSGTSTNTTAGTTSTNTTGTTSTSTDTTGTSSTGTDGTGTTTTGTNSTGTPTTSTDTTGSTTTGTTGDTTGTTTTGTTTTDQTQTQAAPSLLPGDFFYFAKIALEKIELAFTFDDVKEAKLLSNFASERLAEAQALFANGKQDEAVKTIQNSLDDMKDANKIAEQQNSDEANKDDQSDKQTTDGTQAAVQTSQDQTNKNQQNSDTTTGTTQDQGIQDVNNALAQNIVALQAALEHVKNPVARAALQKNIEKSYTKLAQKLAKVEEHFTKESAGQNNTVQGQTSTSQSTTPASATTSTSVETNGTATDAKDSTQVKAEQQNQAPAVTKQNHGKDIKEQVKNSSKAIGQQIKQLNQQYKNLKEQKKVEVKLQNEDQQSNDQQGQNENDHQSKGHGHNN
ncbi:MAG: DUF5667 domain-containing protein [Bacillota bacterium]|nr:DUF5667 domain-containing protein [Bacillota bacterium]